MIIVTGVEWDSVRRFIYITAYDTEEQKHFRLNVPSERAWKALVAVEKDIAPPIIIEEEDTAPPIIIEEDDDS